jgi:predicted amidophosphoribosyltransferase
VWDRGITKARRTPELKDVYNYDERLRLLRGVYTIAQGSLDGETVILFDDLYRSGATLSALTNLLYEQANAAVVYVLTITRTRSNR